MKLLVLSDSHRTMKHMRYAAENTGPDAIIHLGDHISDALELQRQFPQIAFYMVNGNCDIHSAGKNELLLEFDGVVVFVTHGHKYGVKSGQSALINAARDRGAALALFGHTHQVLLEQAPGGLWLMNPGQMMRHDNIAPASYGVVTIEGGELSCGIGYLPR